MLLRTLPLGSLLLLPLLLLTFSQYRVIDDAYISFRYAHNLVTGGELVFNPGEYVEGFTNLLWTLMMTIPIMLGFPVHVFATILGVTFGLVAVVDTWRICRALQISQTVAYISLLPLSLNLNFWLTLTNGLEGGLFSFLLVRTVFLVVSQRPLYLAGLCGGMLFMTRPESILILPIIGLYQAVDGLKQNLGLRDVMTRKVLPLIAPWLACVVAVTSWRALYYGALLPNTITAKSVPISLDLLYTNGRVGLDYCLSFAISSLPLILGTVLAVVLLHRQIFTWLCVGILAAQVVVVLINGGDWMPNYRLLAVFAPLLTVLLAAAIQVTITFLARTYRLRHLIWGTGLLLGATSMALLQGNNWTRAPQLGGGPTEPCWQLLATTLKPGLLPNDVVSPEAIGVFSYILIDTYSHDMLGLTDRNVAQHGTDYIPQYGKAAPAYTYKVIRPNVFVVHSGFGLLQPMAAVSGGQYNNDYSTYALPTLQECEDLEVMISIRNDTVERILPMLTRWAYQPVDVPIQ